jgi:hypothetical protein
MAHLDALIAEYEQVNENFRALADIRFRLLALVPPAGGIAAYLLTKLAEQRPDHPLVLGLSIFGLLVTLGVTWYDQRNSELYNALADRAKSLEALLELPKGQFTGRPKRGRRLLFVLVGHDPALALIYAPVLGAWFYPGGLSAASLFGVAPDQARMYGLAATVIVTAIFLFEFLRLDGVWRRRETKQKVPAQL